MSEFSDCGECAWPRRCGRDGLCWLDAEWKDDELESREPIVLAWPKPDPEPDPPEAT